MSPVKSQTIAINPLRKDEKPVKSRAIPIKPSLEPEREKKRNPGKDRKSYR
jgi:hypothetical protein